MPRAAHIRDADSADLPALTAIRDHYIRSTHYTFDLEPQPGAAWFGRFASRGPHRLLVADAEGEILGYAASQPYRPKAAYASTVETSVYLAVGCEGRGLGRSLYGALIAELEAMALHRAIAVVALPNPASVALHRALEFRSVGVLREAGRKFDRYWDVEIFERALE